MKKVFFFFLISILISQLGLSQQNDPVLFTVDDEPVHVSEFLYIYKKNNAKKADFSEKSLTEYLELYTKFKLKVTKARQMKLDTIPELITELAGYRKQLSKSYLVDKEVNEKLINEVYQRMQKDLNVSHILILNNESGNLEKESLAQAKINYIFNQLEKGISFEALAEEHSEDKSSAANGGNLGYISAMLPDGFYEFENVAYGLKVGEYSKPFRTNYGWHIVKLNNERPARGQIEAAHIMIRKKDKGKIVKGAKALIDSLYERILAGDDFESLAKKYSQDKNSGIKGGYIGIFGINKFEKSFEDAVFKLSKDGAISQAFSTSTGWHIVKRISRPVTDDFEKAKRSINAKISKDSRFGIAREALTERIKKDGNFSEDTSAIRYFISKLDPTFYTFKWKIPDSLEVDLFNLGAKQYTVLDFAKYSLKNQRERLRNGKNTPLEFVVNKFYKDFVVETCMLFEENKLEEKYPDFKSLMREYDEGILLFEATKREVWDKASQDTLGLQAFYEDHKDNYKWRRRAELCTYTIHTDDKKLSKKIYQYGIKKQHDQLIEKFNRDNRIITFERNKVELGNKELSGIKFKVNAKTELIFDDKNKICKFKKILNVLPESPKSLNEAKGYVIADYQEFLEKNWVKSLQEEFDVIVNKKVFNNLIKK